MKIAVCLSGQPRSIEFAKKGLLHHFSSNQHEYDFFCHSWNYNTWKLKDSSFTGDEIVDTKWLQSQLNDFNPKATKISHKYEIDNANGNKYIPWSSLYYSIMVANNLKRQYEIANNFRYDCVVKARYDSLFDPTQQPPFEHTFKMDERVIYFTHCGRMGLEYNRINASECVFFGDSWGMDIACDMYRALPRVCKRYDDYVMEGPGILMSEYLEKSNTLISWAGNYDEMFYRKEVLGLDPISDYHKIKELHHSFY